LRCPEAAGNNTAVNEILADVESLTNHSNFLAERTKFLMDAAMGTMNIAFNGRLNTFTVLSVVLMPPMLVVSIYGMNFEHMPELKWVWGYPMALLLALASAIGPFLYLKHRNGCSSDGPGSVRRAAARHGIQLAHAGKPSLAVRVVRWQYPLDIADVGNAACREQLGDGRT
jgi:hypothetical protein